MLLNYPSEELIFSLARTFYPGKPDHTLVLTYFLHKANEKPESSELLSCNPVKISQVGLALVLTFRCPVARPSEGLPLQQTSPDFSSTFVELSWFRF